jgi:2-dehydro-3-deoxyphosphogluconate aldolase/(4S)-4-hydroxy-2-oxoglutarate aldolase
LLSASLTVPDAHKVFSHLVQNAPDVIVGAGGISDVETARRCLDNGAKFLTSDGLHPEMVNFALKEGAVVIPGTLTPSEVLSAWKMGPDFKVVPCAPVGGDSYIRALKAMFPNVPLIAAGGVNQQTASSFISAGAVALGIGAELIPSEAVRMRQPDRIAELARRFIGFVSSARGRASDR